jgi:hypothetical protein
MKHAIIAGLLVLAIVSFLTLPAGGGGKKPPQPAPPDNDFKGKVLVVFSKAQPPGALLEKAAFRELGPRLFLVGKAPDDKSRWAGSTIWLSMDDVTMIAIFDTLDEAQKVLAK